jgi:2-polyprenyl-3-methyl-5-hydroxy-6-metoxy-1,4-benzoquinol methylase
MQFRNGLRLNIYRCADCGHRWLPATADQQRQIELSYSREYAGFRMDEHFNSVVTRELEQRIGAIARPPARLLDVGCGNGEFLAAATRFGYQAKGIDISEGAVALACEKKLDAIAGDFLTQEFGDHYSLVTMWDVLEHLQNPFQFVSRARELLHEQGALVIKVPSYGSANFALLHAAKSRSSVLLGAPDHVQYFTKESLSRLLHRAGFDHLTWFPDMTFRSKRPSRSLRKILARSLQKQIGRLAKNQNLYLMAVKERAAIDTAELNGREVAV